MTSSSNENFPSEIEAAYFLLQDSTEVLTTSGVKFVVVGGWAPYFFHRERYGHPGTFDADILLDSASLDDGTFYRATETMLSGGYLRAPKNNFQAHRVLRVEGEELVFHVDFLNERDPGNEIEFIGGIGRLKSIYTPVMRAVFAYENFRFARELPGVRFPSPETFIATKAAAALVAKRTRDAFDAFVTVSDQNPEEFRRKWGALVEKDGLFCDANDSLWRAVHEDTAIEKIRRVLDALGKGRNIDDDHLRTQFRFLKPPRSEKSV